VELSNPVLKSVISVGGREEGREKELSYIHPGKTTGTKGRGNKPPNSLEHQRGSMMCKDGNTENAGDRKEIKTDRPPAGEFTATRN